MKSLPLFLAASFLLAGTVFSSASDSHEGMMEGAHSGMDHSAMMQHGAPAPAITEGGQAAFAAIQEIVAALFENPGTDWTKVNIEALRQHLIDMDNVTLRAKVAAEDIPGGARFTVTSDDPGVQASIRAMTLAHAATMDGVEGWSLEAAETEDGAMLTATGDEIRIRALGFIGLMTVGMHHQEHHFALARGEMPH
ncbi:MAG: hypothetical protein CL535_00780 [Ahrensia sp.]|nr:hypothetical protein [Ahrensia sp.]|tara:strand:- start:20629 stop:21213 length:585 start_codon:yes stop_codon:yes gene_type:complete